MRLITDWFKRTFSDPQIVFLTLVLAIGFAVVLTMGDMLAPVLASAVIAYLLEGLVVILEDRGLPRWISVTLVFVVFVLFLALVLFGLMPMLSRQVTELIQQLPVMISVGQQALMTLPERFPDVISPAQAQEILDGIRREIGSYGQEVLTMSISSVVGVLTIVVYLVLMPMLVFFFLKDKDIIVRWFSNFMPTERSLANLVWLEVDRQIANYVRGKFWEIIIVWAASFVAFSYFGLQYAMLLAVIVGLSVVVPYVGATVVTFPVVLVAWFQWGWGQDFIWVSVTYLIIQALDGNVLVPLLFGEVVNLHPIAIIVAILVFGGLWGFWGVFFAIPLATLVNAVLRAWPARKPLPKPA
ncbi:AI-2E family transporter [Thiosocius teredinicola]|uniref:AI-2E family transporter n=1 Tax=Thiosocius teredinicola TaxID=1973002 RepID=UPI000990E266